MSPRRAKPKADSKAPTPRVRICMTEQDKLTISRNLFHNFMVCGASEEEAKEVLSHGSVPIATWISRWICHNTNYKDERKVTEDMYRQGAFAWMHYKATAKTICRKRA